MKTLKQILMAGAFVVLASAATFAQKNDDQKKGDQKKNPPVVIVNPEGKKPKEDKPRDNRDDRKKPQGEFMGEFREVELLD